MKFSYRDKVKVKAGFFKGQTARVMDFRQREFKDTDDEIHYADEYALAINGLNYNWVDEDYLELIERNAS